MTGEYDKMEVTANVNEGHTGKAHVSLHLSNLYTSGGDIVMVETTMGNMTRDVDMYVPLAVAEAMRDTLDQAITQHEQRKEVST